MNKTSDPVPYLVHEGEMFRMERCNKRLSILCAALTMLVAVIICLIAGGVL